MPTVVVDDDAPLRQDIDSDEARLAHPDLPDSPRARNRYLQARDRDAYATIRARVPGMVPPQEGKAEAARVRTSAAPPAAASPSASPAS